MLASNWKDVQSYFDQSRVEVEDLTPYISSNEKSIQHSYLLWLKALGSDDLADASLNLDLYHDGTWHVEKEDFPLIIYRQEERNFLFDQLWRRPFRAEIYAYPDGKEHAVSVHANEHIQTIEEAKNTIQSIEEILLRFLDAFGPRAMREQQANAKS